MSKKIRVKKHITHTHGGGAEKMFNLLKSFAADWEGRQKELVEKHNEMAAQLAAQEQLTQQVAQFATSEFGKMQARLNLYFQSIDQALHHHDVNDIAAAEILKEIFGQLTQVDVFLKRLSVRVSDREGVLDLAGADVANIKKEALEWFDSTVASAFKVANEAVEEQRKAAEEQSKAEQARIAAEKEKAAADKEEAARMESELQKAEREDRGLEQASSFTEQEALGLPPDVKVFGMT